MARDAYSFLHLPLVAGVVLTALGFKKVLEYVGGGEHHHLTDPLKGVGLYALYGGVALTLLAMVAFKYRTTRILGVPRIVAVVVVLALIPVAALVPAIAALAILAAVMVALLAFETLHYAELRYRVRHDQHTEPADSAGEA